MKLVVWLFWFRCVGASLSECQATTVTMMIPVGREDAEERLVSYLPLSHVAGMMVGFVNVLFW